MARDLNLNVLLRAVDKATKPLKDIQRGSGKTAEALKASRTQLRQLEAAQKDLRGFRELKRGSERTSRALEEQQHTVRELTRAIKTTDGPTRRLNQQRDKAIRTARTLKRRYEGEQRQLQELRGTMRRVDGVTGSYNEQQRELARRTKEANRQIERQERHLANVARRQKRAAAAAERYRRTQDRAGRMAGTGAGGLATGGAALYAGARLLSPGIEYGEQISELQAITRLQKDSAEYRMLARQSRDLGSSTQFSATEAAAGQTFLARTGFTPGAIRASMRDVLDLALAGRMDLGRAADISSNIMSAFKIDPEIEGNMQRVADTLTATSTRANVDLEMLGESMKYLGQAEGLDISLEQAAAMAGMLGDIGIQGSMAGTTLRAMMSRLAAPTKAAQGVIEELGLQLTDTEGNLRAIPDILAQIGEATEGIGNAKRTGMLAEIFGLRAASGMSDLIAREGAGGLTKFVDILEGAAGENARVAATMADNVGGDLKALRSAWEEVGISVTDTNEGPMRRTIQRTTEITRAVGDWIKENPELASTISIAATAVAALVAGGGALTLVLAGLLGPIALTRYGMTLLGIQSLGVRDKFGAAGAGMKRFATTAIPTAVRALFTLRGALLATGVGAIAVAIGAAAMLIIRYWEPIKAFFAGVGTGIAEALSGVMDTLGPLGTLLRSIGSGIGSVIGWFGRLFAPVDASADTLTGAANAGRLVGNVLGKVMVPAILAVGAALIANPIGATIAAIGAAAYLIYDNWGAIGGWFGDRWRDIREAFSGGMAGVGRLLLSWNPITPIYAALVAGLESLGVKVPQEFRTFGSAIIDGLIGGFGERLGALRDAVTGAASAVSDWFKSSLGINSPSRVFMQHGNDTLEGYRRGVAERENAALGQVKAFGKRVRQAGAGLALGAAATAAPAMPELPPRPPLQIDIPTLPALEARTSVPDMPAVSVRMPDLPRLGVEPARLPALPDLALQAPAIEPLRILAPDLPALEARATAPDMPAVSVRMPDLPRLGVESPRLPALPDLALQAPALEPLRTLAPNLPALEARTSVPDMPDLGVDTSPARLRLDNRPPLPAGGSNAGGGVTVQGGIHITVHPARGMDEQALARHVASEVERAMADAGRDRDRRRRSALYDTD
ncbi:MAG: phage tail tape measure protein [Salinisphaeraceae bacterium]